MQITETESCERNLAFSWFTGIYSKKDAQLSAELQSLDFKNVEKYYGEFK